MGVNGGLCIRFRRETVGHGTRPEVFSALYVV